jgi:hypothetical protein
MDCVPPRAVKDPPNLVRSGSRCSIPIACCVHLGWGSERGRAEGTSNELRGCVDRRQRPSSVTNSSVTNSPKTTATWTNSKLLPRDDVGCWLATLARLGLRRNPAVVFLEVLWPKNSKSRSRVLAAWAQSTPFTCTNWPAITQTCQLVALAEPDPERVHRFLSSTGQDIPVFPSVDAMANPPSAMPPWSSHLRKTIASTRSRSSPPVIASCWRSH